MKYDYPKKPSYVLPLLNDPTLDSHVFRSNSELFEDSWEVVFDDISLHRIIGEGAFGKVYSGRLLKQIMEIGKGRKSLKRKTDKGQQQMKMGLTVAVKMLRSMVGHARVL